MGSAGFFSHSSHIFIYSVGYGVNRVQVVLSGFSVRLLCFGKAKLYVGMAVRMSCLHSCVCV